MQRILTADNREAVKEAEEEHQGQVAVYNVQYQEDIRFSLVPKLIAADISKQSMDHRADFHEDDEHSSSPRLDLQISPQNPCHSY